MSARKFDAVIVGARCAGASLATHLARAGLSVALLDAARLPSEQPISTHLIQPPGMDELDALGVGDAVRCLSPSLRAARLDFDGREMLLGYGAGRAAHCLRREKLDGFLQETAVAAGADLQAESRVVGIARGPAARVCGVEVRRRNGTVERLDADFVVGADGRQSTVARLVGAEEYLRYDGPRGSYWAYWRRPPAWDRHLIYNGFCGHDVRVVFPTDDDLILIATVPPLREARAWHRTEDYVADLRAFEPIGSFLRDAAPVSPVRRILNASYFFRVSAGPGWALVGDAGHHKDFVVGLGISDAMRDARSLAGAITTGTDAALEQYWRQRDVERLEMFRWSQDLGRADAVTALERLVAERKTMESLDDARLGAVIDGRMSPYDLVPPEKVACWVGMAVLRGHVDLLPPFAATVLRALRVRTELRLRKRHLAAGRFVSPTRSDATRDRSVLHHGTVLQGR